MKAYKLNAPVDERTKSYVIIAIKGSFAHWWAGSEWVREPTEAYSYWSRTAANKALLQIAEDAKRLGFHSMTCTTGPKHSEVDWK